MNGETKNRKRIAGAILAAVLFAIVLAFAFCAKAKAADPCDQAREATAKQQAAELELAQAQAALRAAEAKAKAAKPKGDPFSGLSVPLSAGYFAGNPVLAAGLEKQFAGGLAVSAQFLAGRVEGQDVPTGLDCLPIVKAPERSETGFLVTVRIPF